MASNKRKTSSIKQKIGKRKVRNQEAAKKAAATIKKAAPKKKSTATGNTTTAKNPKSVKAVSKAAGNKQKDALRAKQRARAAKLRKKK